MTISKFVGVCILAALTTGCSSASDISLTATKENPDAIECHAPGTPQGAICNYRLVVKHLHDNVFQGHVDPELVMLSEQYCRDAARDLKSGNDPSMVTKDVTCQNAASYKYTRYEFEIDDERPRDGAAIDLVNIPNTNKMKIGHLGPQQDNIDVSRVPDIDTMKAKSN